MRKMGEKVTLKMLVNCPEIILELGKSSQKDIGGESEDNHVVDEPADVFIEDQVNASKKDQFVCLQLKDTNVKGVAFYCWITMKRHLY